MENLIESVHWNLLFIIILYFRLDSATNELKETTPYVARFNELNSKFNQTLIDNKNLEDANKASIVYLMIILNVED